ncbi:MAG: hypothetical protein AB1650_05535 [Candidatus Omnitrophota bacterium]
MKKSLLLLFLFITTLGGSKVSFAERRVYPLLTQGQYFSVYAFPQMDCQQLLQKIHYDDFFPIRPFDSKEDSCRELVAKTLDAVYLEVSDTLGINVYSFKGSIKIFPDREMLNEEYLTMFREGFTERAFYFHEEAALYLSFEDLDVALLTHEMTHVIISNYFIVPPSPKLQEILSGYAEYHFRKRLNLLFLKGRN